MSVKEMYQYVYYKIYKIMDTEAFHWGADFRASLFMNIFEIFTISSILVYFSVIFNIALNRNAYIVICMIMWGVLILFHAKYFYDHDHREVIIAKFDAWSIKKDIIGTIIVWGVLILLVVNFIYSINLYTDKFL